MSMGEDSAYLTTSIKSLNHLLQGVKGEWANIPETYSDYFHHCYSDGDISLLPAMCRFTGAEDLEKWQVEEAIEMLLKVNPIQWPDCDSIESIDLGSLLSDFPPELDFVEDNLGTSERAQKVLKAVIESVFGDKVSTIRSRSGKFPDPSNNFLQDKDGTFAGTFKYDDFTFEFEIIPTEKDWVCTYRLNEKSLEKLNEPKFKGGRKEDRPNHRKVRSRGWR